MELSRLINDSLLIINCQNASKLSNVVIEKKEKKEDLFKAHFITDKCHVEYHMLIQ